METAWCCSTIMPCSMQRCWWCSPPGNNFVNQKLPEKIVLLTRRPLCLSEGHVTRVCDVMWCQINKQPLSVARQPREGRGLPPLATRSLGCLVIVDVILEGNTQADRRHDMTCKVIHLVQWECVELVDWRRGRKRTQLNLGVSVVPMRKKESVGYWKQLVKERRDVEKWL